MLMDALLLPIKINDMAVCVFAFVLLIPRLIYLTFVFFLLTKLSPFVIEQLYIFTNTLYIYENNQICVHIIVDFTERSTDAEYFISTLLQCPREPSSIDSVLT